MILKNVSHPLLGQVIVVLHVVVTVTVQFLPLVAVLLHPVREVVVQNLLCFSVNLNYQGLICYGVAVEKADGAQACVRVAQLAEPKGLK